MVGVGDCEGHVLGSMRCRDEHVEHVAERLRGPMVEPDTVFVDRAWEEEDVFTHVLSECSELNVTCSVVTW